MIKRKFGEDFRTKLNDNLEVKARADGKKEERKPRENK